MSHFKAACLVLLMLATGAAADVNVSREAIVKHLSENVSVMDKTLYGLMSDQEKEEFNKHVRGRIEKMAAEMLPESFSLKSERDAREILPRLSLPFADPELAELHIQEVMIEANIFAIFAHEFPEPDVEGITSDLKYLVDGMREKSVTHLSQWYDIDEINQLLDQRFENNVGKILQKKEHEMKVRVDKQVMDEMLEEFEKEMVGFLKTFPKQQPASEEARTALQRRTRIVFNAMYGEQFNAFGNASSNRQMRPSGLDEYMPVMKEIHTKTRARMKVLNAQVAAVMAPQMVKENTEYYERTLLGPAIDETMSNLPSEPLKPAEPGKANEQVASQDQLVKTDRVSAHRPAEGSMFREYGWALALAGIVGGVAAGLVVRMRKNKAAH